MQMKLINIGYGNMVNADKIIAVVSPEASPVKRIVQNAKDKGLAIDATQGKKTAAVIVCESDHVVLSALSAETISHRLKEKEEISKENE
ncbi:MAG: DUF370 domain-containing protein [Clostridia bacterium]